MTANRLHLRALRAVLAVPFTFAFALASAAAMADDKQACSAAYEKAQQLRIDTKLRDAQEQLAICSRPACPSILRQDCVQWIGEVGTSLPSIVIAARDANGRDVLDVRVTLDGAVVAERLDGKPISLDPGPHRLRYETAGKPPVDEQILVREGEKNRPLTLTFTPAPAPSTTQTPARPSAATAPPPSDPARDAGAQSSAAVPIALIGGGVLALGAAVFFDLKATGDAHTLRDVCSPNCRQPDVDAVQTKYVAAGISLGIGIVGVGLGATLLAMRQASKTSPSQAAARGFTFDATPVRGGASASLGGVF